MSKKLNLTKEDLEIIKDIEFKTEGLGALEFKMNVTDASWETKEVEFRIERVTPQTFLKIADKKGLEGGISETLKNMVALPVEARETDFFTYDTEALGVLSKVCTEFQKTPLVFRGGNAGLEKLVSE